MGKDIPIYVESYLSAHKWVKCPLIIAVASLLLQFSESIIFDNQNLISWSALNRENSYSS